MKTSINVKVFLDKIWGLLSGQRYQQALKILGNIKPARTRLISQEYPGELHFLTAWAYMGMGKFDQSLREIKTGLGLIDIKTHTALFASMNQLLGVVFRNMGKLEESEEALQLAGFVRRKLTKENDKIYSLLVNHSLTHFLKGDLNAARDRINEALAYAKKYNSSDVQAKRTCLLNKAMILLFLGRFTEAESLLSSLNLNDLPEANKAFVHEKLGMISVFMLDHDKAFNHLSMALKSYKALKMHREQIICREYLGLNEYFSQNYKDAKKFYSGILKSKTQLSASANAQTLRLLADAYIATGEIKKAETAAGKASKAIAKVSERIEEGALHRALGQIHANLGEREKAQKHFDSSIEILSTTGARYELALTYLACGSLDIYTIDVRLHYLQRAKTAFADMGVKKRVEQIEQIMQMHLFDGVPMTWRALNDLNRKSTKFTSLKKSFKDPAIRNHAAQEFKYDLEGIRITWGQLNNLRKKFG